MLSLADRIRRILRQSSLVLLLGGVVSFVGLVGVASATNSDINVGISGSPAPSLQITSPSSPSTVTSMPLLVTGDINNLTQIQVFVDGAFSSTIPLTPTATDFTYSLNLTSGTHTVQFVGISAYTSTNPTVTISVTYTPSHNGGTIDPSDGGDGNPSQPNNGDGTGGVVIGGPTLGDNRPTGLTGVSMPQWLYGGLVFFDIINPDRTTDTGAMVWRFIWLLLALFLVIFARPTLYMYRKIRYDWLRLNKRPLMDILRRYPLFWIRVLGLAIAIAVFIYT